MPPSHARSDEFLELVRRSRQGRLKVFLGPAAGVGKTYRMLQEAHQLKGRGVDVVVGVIDTHGREETVALTHGLAQVPLRKVEYRGVELEELDVSTERQWPATRSRPGSWAPTFSSKCYRSCYKMRCAMPSKP